MMFGTDFDVVSLLWVVLSAASTCSTIVGAYWPHWLVGTFQWNGTTMSTSFSSFRRCNYPMVETLTAGPQIRIVQSCGRYATFADIPSIFWQLSTVLMAVGCLLSITLTLFLLFNCCVAGILRQPSLTDGGSLGEPRNRNRALLVGIFHAICAIFISVGCLAFPLGWRDASVRDLCGSRSAWFELGDCHIGWPYKCSLVGATLHLTCGAFSIFASRHNNTEIVQEQYDVSCGRWRRKITRQYYC